MGGRKVTEIIRDANGNTRLLGCLPRTTTLGDGTFKVFDPDKGKTWRPRRLEPIKIDDLVWHIIDQKQQGSCCGAAGCGIMMLVREIMGLERVVLSQASLYGQGNGGRDQGMAIDTCLKILRDVGACPVDTIAQYDWQGYGRGTWPNRWRTEARRYQIEDAYDCPNLEILKAANEDGHPVLYGSKGHAVYRLFDDANSWGRNWGRNGFGIWATDSDLRRDMSQYGAWILRVATDPINDGDLPQPN